jgi:zinc protease
MTFSCKLRLAGVAFLALLLLLAQTVPFAFAQLRSAATDVTRATLDNGLRVVIVRDPLAPVVTVMENYLVGGQETPDGFPGMAHAQEHMAFRGCAGISADQIAAIYAQLGGDNNADTQQNITQYFATVPAADLDIALRLDAACMQDIVDSQDEWSSEKGAIEQEVARDLSNPTYKFITRLNEDMFSGSVYSHDALGTKDSFDGTTGAMLKDFYKKWYAPNNAVLVITGDVDPKAALAKVKELYGKIEKRALPVHPAVTLPAVKAESFTLDSNLPYLLVFVAYRMPGTDSPDFPAMEILADVLGSQRANLFDLVPQGKALQTEFGLAEHYTKASVAYSAAVLPSDGDGAPIIAEMRKIMANYASNGVPAELVEAEKRKEIASAQFRRNSIPGLAQAWSEAVAAEGRNSPDEEVEAMKRVTPADVNRVAKKYLVDQECIAAELKPKPTGEPVAANGFGGFESLAAAPTKAVELPSWAASRLLTLNKPPAPPPSSDVTLPNGLRLIVRTEKITPTVTVVGTVRQEPQLETPAGKDGASAVLEDLFSYGTESLDRLAFRKALDDIAAEESGGFSFSLDVLKQDFSRGMQLLAANELNPALPEDAFNVVKPQTARSVAGRMRSPGYQNGRALDYALYPKNDPALRETTPDTVSSLTLDDLKQYYAKAFRPDLTTMVVIGDIRPAEARSAVEKYFGSWKAAGAKPDVDLPSVPPNKPSATTVPDPSQLQDSVNLSQTIGITRFDPDYYPLQLGNHVLGGGFYATRLYHDLRQVNGYVYNVDVRINAGKTRTLYTVVYGCDPQNVSKARDLIRRDLIAMQKEDVTDAELQQAKALLLRQIPLAESSENSVARGLLGRAQIGLPLDEPVKGAQLYYSLTADQVRAAFAKWIRPDEFVQVVRGPAPQ